MRRRRFLGLASGVTGSLALTATGCGGGGASQLGEATLTMVATDYGDLEGNDLTHVYWDELVSSFERKHPGITVDVTVHAPGSAEKKVADLVKKGKAPDLAQIDSFAEYAAAGQLYRADELLSIPVQADFVPALASAGELRRVQYALPFVASLQLLFYNRKLFVKAGLNPDQPPKTWAELKQAAIALKAVGVNVPYGLPFGPEDAQTEAMTWMLSNGGGYTGKGGLYTINASENVEAVSWLREEIVGRGLTTINPAATSRQVLFDLFTRGEVGMLNGSLSLMQQADRKKLDYGMAPLPGNGGLSEATMGFAHWMLAFKQNDNRVAIGAFLDHVFAVDNHYQFAHRYHTLPVTVSASERMRTDERHERMWPFLDQLGAAEFAPAGKASWPRVSKEIRKHIGQAVMSDGDPKSVLARLQGTAESEDDAARKR